MRPLRPSPILNAVRRTGSGAQSVSNTAAATASFGKLLQEKHLSERELVAQRAAARRDRIEMEQQLRRRFNHGDVYAPRDLGVAEQRKAKMVKFRPKQDIFDVLQVDPMSQYRNVAIMSEFITSTGRIKGRNETGLRPVNQRKLARAIRRSMGIGLMPRIHKHPEIIAQQLQRRLRM
ncbi:ribosomal protein S18 [Lineolata rhizophorae]|uniref:Small ribosomal subunit protein bS18m n=1 Tax=Lineolata rhizophorae TaxID=578093 RepID=A0A6A6P2G9_9PEZI|nr:ribosomal protein S18 [Lineolata rhizophorae]